MRRLGGLTEDSDISNVNLAYVLDDGIKIKIASLAMKIIQYREQNGKFSAIEDLKNVNGIGDSKYENIKDLISVK